MFKVIQCRRVMCEVIQLWWFHVWGHSVREGDGIKVGLINNCVGGLDQGMRSFCTVAQVPKFSSCVCVNSSVAKSNTFKVSKSYLALILILECNKSVNFCFSLKSRS